MGFTSHGPGWTDHIGRHQMCGSRSTSGWLSWLFETEEPDLLCISCCPGGYALHKLESESPVNSWGECHASDGRLKAPFRKAMDVYKQRAMHHQLVGCRIGLIDDGTVVFFYPRGYMLSRASTLQPGPSNKCGKREGRVRAVLVQMPGASRPSQPVRGPILATE